MKTTLPHSTSVYLFSVKCFCSIGQPLNQSTNQPINQSTLTPSLNQPINQLTNQPTNQSTNQSTTHSITHSITHSLPPSLTPSIHKAHVLQCVPDDHRLARIEHHTHRVLVGGTRHLAEYLEGRRTCMTRVKQCMHCIALHYCMTLLHCIALHCIALHYCIHDIAYMSLHTWHCIHDIALHYCIHVIAYMSLHTWHCVTLLHTWHSSSRNMSKKQLTQSTQLQWHHATISHPSTHPPIKLQYNTT
jgi:hypothetical protein